MAVSHPQWQFQCFRNCEGLHTKKDYAIVARACFIALWFSVVFFWLAYGTWASTGRGVRTSRIRSAKIITAKISSEESGRIPTRFAPAKISRYMVPYLQGELQDKEK